MNDFASAPYLDTVQATLNEMDPAIDPLEQAASISGAMVYGDLFAKAFFAKKGSALNRVKP